MANQLYAELGRNVATIVGTVFVLFAAIELIIAIAGLRAKHQRR